MLVILGSWGRKVQNLRPACAICSETVSKNPRVGDVVPPWVWSLNPVSKAAHTQSNVFFPEQVACRAGLTVGVPWFCLPSAAAFCPLSHAHPPPPVLRVWVSPWISPLVKEKGVTACSQPPLFLPELVLWPQGLRGPSQTDVFLLFVLRKSGAHCVGKEALSFSFNLKPSEFERTNKVISLLLPLEISLD